MRIPNYLLLPFLVVIVVLAFCKKEVPEKPFTPLITLGFTELEGKIFDTATVTVAVNAPGLLKQLTITKFKGAKIDSSFETAGVLTLQKYDYKLKHIFVEGDLNDTVRYKIHVEDELGQAGDATLTITTVPSARYLLKKFNWRWDAKIGSCLNSDTVLVDMIKDCERDNIFIFSGDSTLNLDYGLLTGAGGGSCDTDGVYIYKFWSLNKDQSELTLTQVNPTNSKSIRHTYRINTIDFTNLKTSTTFDFSASGCDYTGDWNINFKSQPK